jgi:hypothetical protein
LGEDDGEPLDVQPKDAYKQRVVGLTEELKQAREFPYDEERIGHIEDEVDFYKRELKTAFGLSDLAQSLLTGRRDQRGTKIFGLSVRYPGLRSLPVEKSIS